MVLLASTLQLSEECSDIVSSWYNLSSEEDENDELDPLTVRPAR